MKVFIAGARSIKTFGEAIEEKLISIYDNKLDVLVGDCYGVDSAVQQFYSKLNYRNLTVYASNGIARNNIGNWEVKNITVNSSAKGFDFYKQKDIAMAQNADCGFMIWDGKSKGTLNNIINLIKNDKKVQVYLTHFNIVKVVRNQAALDELITLCPSGTKAIYKKLIADNSQEKHEQLSLI